MELKEKLNKKSLTELNEIKNTVDSITNLYAEQLTDYALMSGDNSLINLPDDKKELYQKRMKYKNLSLIIQEVIINKIDELLC